MTESWSGIGRLHIVFTLLLTGTLLTLGVLLATGQMELRFRNRRQDTSSAVAASSTLPGPRFERVRGAAEVFEVLGQKAFCFRYEGAWVDCWIELEQDGKTTRFAERIGEQLRLISRGLDGELREKPSGYLVWIRRQVKEKEVWDLAVSLGENDGGFRLTDMVAPQAPASHGSFEEESSNGSLETEHEVTLAYFRLTYE